MGTQKSRSGGGARIVFLAAARFMARMRLVDATSDARNAASNA
jgi:hypothetical protein